MKRKSYNRGVVLFAAAVTGGVTGAIYMWSIFKNPLMLLNNWTSNQVTMAYSLYMLSMCIAGMLSGYLQRKIKPNILVLVSGLTFGAGWILTSYASELWMLYLFFSIIAGFGNGFIYNTAVSTAAKWYPDKKGFANGMCIGCMGLAPLLFAPLGNSFISRFGVLISFKICGVIFAVVYMVFSWFLKTPDQNWVPPETNNKEAQPLAQNDEISTRQMIKMKSFWLMWLLFSVSTSAGAMITGHAAGIGQQQAQMTAAQASLMVGILAVGNFAGRFGFGALSDRIGRFRTLYLILIISVVDMIVFFGRATSFAGFMAVLCVIGACYGGVMTTMPSLCSDSFGAKNFAMNYAVLFTGFTFASFVGPMLASNILQLTGKYDQAYIAAGLLSAVGIGLLFVLSKSTDKKIV